jgi:nicotinamide mononucleotide (NMN) deamidase PncC
MPLFARWRAERDLQRKAQSFVAVLFREPGAADVQWLAEAATRGDADHALWELRYARRALGLIAAQRDALDDRTASVVARVMAEALGRDQNIASEMTETAERQFNARLSAYRDGLAAKAGAPTPIRMGQTLFAFAGGSFKNQDSNIVRAGDLLAAYLAEANEALRASFGTAVLPENVPPSQAVER